MTKIKDQKREERIHIILAGVHLNGFIQGQIKEKINVSVLEIAKKQIFKEIAKAREEMGEALDDWARDERGGHYSPKVGKFVYIAELKEFITDYLIK